MQDLDFLQTEEMEQLLERARDKYDVAFEPVRIGGLTLDILQIADMEAYIDYLAETTRERLELPFWAKIWPASVILGYYLGTLPPEKPLDMLELGAGVGLCGLAAASRGHKVLITDNHPDALLFSRINILRNNLQEHASVQAADFTSDRLSRRFNCILGAEVLYQEDTYPQLVRFLTEHLGTSPDDEIILSASNARKSPSFFQRAQETFQLSHKTLECRDKAAADSTDQESHRISIYRMKARQ